VAANGAWVPPLHAIHTTHTAACFFLPDYCMLCLQPWEFKAVAMGVATNPLGFGLSRAADAAALPVCSPLGICKHQWTWCPRRTKWVCSTEVTAITPASLGRIIRDGWDIVDFMFNSTTVCDAVARCQHAELRYAWESSMLTLKAYFKKTSKQGTQITT
jgi:hypothetical protein